MAPTPNPLHDSDDQRKMRAFTDGLAKQMREAGYGGIIILSSLESSSWELVIPPWSGIQRDPLTGQLRLQLKLRKNNPEVQKVADATVGHLVDMRDISSEITTIFSGLYEYVKQKLTEHGAAIENKPIGSPGKVGPTGKVKS